MKVSAEVIVIDLLFKAPLLACSLKAMSIMLSAFPEQVLSKHPEEVA